MPQSFHSQKSLPYFSTITHPHPFQLIQQPAFCVTFLFNNFGKSQQTSKLLVLTSIDFHKNFFLTFIIAFSSIVFNSDDLLFCRRNFLIFIRQKTKSCLLFLKRNFSGSWMRDFDAKGVSFE